MPAVRRVGAIRAFNRQMRFNLRRLGLLSGKAARRFARRAGLTPQRIDLMLLVRRSRLSQREIASQLCVSPSVVSRILDALVELGLVERTCDLHDGRIRVPELTHTGRERLARCFPDPTFHGAQDEGEITWLAYWRTSIANLGIQVDSILDSVAPAYFDGYAVHHECYVARRPADAA